MDGTMNRTLSWRLLVLLVLLLATVVGVCVVSGHSEADVDNEHGSHSGDSDLHPRFPESMTTQQYLQEEDVISHRRESNVQFVPAGMDNLVAFSRDAFASDKISVVEITDVALRRRSPLVSAAKTQRRLRYKNLENFRFGVWAGDDLLDKENTQSLIVYTCTAPSDIRRCCSPEKPLPDCCHWTNHTSAGSNLTGESDVAHLTEWLMDRSVPPVSRLTWRNIGVTKKCNNPTVILYLPLEGASRNSEAKINKEHLACTVDLARKWTFGLEEDCEDCWSLVAIGAESVDQCHEECRRKFYFKWAPLSAHPRLNPADPQRLRNPEFDLMPRLEIFDPATGAIYTMRVESAHEDKSDAMPEIEDPDHPSYIAPVFARTVNEKTLSTSNFTNDFIEAYLDGSLEPSIFSKQLLRSRLTVSKVSSDVGFMSTDVTLPNQTRVVIVGAGPAGIGMAVALKQAEIDEVIVIEKGAIGQSLRSWPEKMQWITPSFYGNPFKAVDLNSIDPHSSPGYVLNSEHPTGMQYSEYLRKVVDARDLNVYEHSRAKWIQPTQGEYDGTPSAGFNLCIHHQWTSEYTACNETTGRIVFAQYVIWAGGQWHNQILPHVDDLYGWIWGVRPDDKNWMTLRKHEDAETVLVVGGGESGMDAALSLVEAGVPNVYIFDKIARWENSTQGIDRLSLFTQHRLEQCLRTGQLHLVAERVRAVEAYRHRKTNKITFVVTASRHKFKTDVPPIITVGFHHRPNIIQRLFAWDIHDNSTQSNGRPYLTPLDESTITPGLFMAGPAVSQLLADGYGGTTRIPFENLYQYRTRFPVVANAISQRIGKDAKEALGTYRSHGMYMDAEVV